MRFVFLLCATFALSIATDPADDGASVQDLHQDEMLPAQMLEREKQEESVPEEEARGKILPRVKQTSCPSGWSRYGSRCFIFIHRQMTWVDAERYCLRVGTNLASIHNYGEYEFIQEVVRGGTGRFPQAWIGGNDAVKDHAWLWSDGSGFYFHDWSFGEPDNRENNEKCLVMNRPDDLLWGDLNCEQRLPFICGTRPT